MANEKDEPHGKSKSNLHETVAEWEQIVRERLQEEEERRRKQQLRWAFIALICSTVGITAGIVGYVGSNRTRDLDRASVIMETMASRLGELQGLSQSVSNRLSELNAQILATHTTNVSDVAILAEQSKINGHLQELDKRLSVKGSVLTIKGSVLTIYTYSTRWND